MRNSIGSVRLPGLAHHLNRRDKRARRVLGHLYSPADGFAGRGRRSQRLVAWGEAHPSVHAMILTSSRAKPNGRADMLSDYDIIVAVRDTAEFLTTDSWVSAYG
jgi:hypothetical protein